MADVWIIPRPARVSAAALDRASAKRLAPDERRRARALGPGERAEYCAFRLALRAVLARYRPDLADGAAFARGPHGKPSLDGGPEFSFSATAGRALVAVCEGAPIGIDVERVRDIPFAGAALGREPGLAAFLERADARPQDPTLAFLRAWTRLEAALKRHGLALGPALGEINIAAMPARFGRGGSGRAAASEISDIDAGHGFVAACAHAPGQRITLRRFDWRALEQQAPSPGVPD